MEHTITVYYTHCPNRTELSGNYLDYQREIAEKILNYGLRKHFHIEFDKHKVVKGNHGKPYWSGEEPIRFNISHTKGLVVCAIASQEIGVDAEGPRKVGALLLRRSCSKEEISYILDGREGLLEQGGKIVPGQGKKALGKDISRQEKELLGELEQERFLRIWTLKESYIKMTGEGMAFPLQEAEFLIEEKGNGKSAISSSQPGFFTQKKINDYWVSVCSSKPAEVIWQQF